MDVSSDSVYLFLTDYTDSSNDQLSNFAPADNSTTPAPTTLLYKGVGCYIVRYYVNTFTFKVLVAGNFLNFSKTHPIINVNLLENLLFFTDDRNQPRKINVDLANPQNLATPIYYTTEDQISVAKYNPYAAINLYELSTESSSVTDVYQSTMKDVVSKFMPTGGSAIVATSGTNTDSFSIENGVFNFYPNKPAEGQKVGKIDRKSTRLNSSHTVISYAVFCLKKKNKDIKLQ